MGIRLRYRLDGLDGESSASSIDTQVADDKVYEPEKDDSEPGPTNDGAAEPVGIERIGGFMTFDVENHLDEGGSDSGRGLSASDDCHDDTSALASAIFAEEEAGAAQPLTIGDGEIILVDSVGSSLSL